MAEAARNEVANESTHAQRQNIPTPVKMVAAVYLLGAVVHSFYFFFFVSTAVAELNFWRCAFAAGSFFKVWLSIALARGLLNLSEGWRAISLITSGLGVLILPFYFLAVIFSSDFALLVSKLSGIDSLVVVKLVPAIGFAMFLWMFRTLIRPDVNRAF